MKVARLAWLSLATACDGGAHQPPLDAMRECTSDLHDEDGDGVVDICDNCPATANPTQADTTEVAVHAFADGIGDACDFRPGLSGDKASAFFSWAAPEQAAAWTGSGWTIETDELRAAATARWEAVRRAGGDGLIVVARIPALTWTAASGGALTIAIDGDGINAGDTCTLRQAAAGDELVTQEITGGSNVTAVSGDPTGEQTLVAWRRLTSVRNEIACRVVRGTQQTNGVVELTDDLITGSYALAVDGATVRVSSLIVLTSPGPKTP